MIDLTRQDSSMRPRKAQAERLVIVGNPEEVHVGAHLRLAAGELGYNLHFCDSREAYAGPGWWQKVNWHLRAHRPARLAEFGRLLERACRDFGATSVLTTGIAPIDQATLERIGRSGTRRVNFLTDDPWNPALYAPWFLRTVPHYDQIFSPRRANLEDLRRAGCPDVRYLPFAYAPGTHFAEVPATPQERERLAADVIFAGGADRDRRPWIHSLIDAGVSPALYGGYWDRDPKTKAFARGIAGAQAIRQAVGAAKVSLCLVRRANRDGHAMRTFELAAMAACILAEDTDEHRAILGGEGEGAIYFRTASEMVEKVRWLLSHESERRRLAAAARNRVSTGKHTYADRLAAMVERP